MLSEKNPQAQYIDQTGKVRAIMQDGFWIFTEPLHPFPCPIQDFEENDPKAQEFFKNKKIITHLTTKKEVMGIYFEEEGRQYYVPIKYSGNPSEFEFSYLDIRVGKKAREYKKFLDNQKLAKLLKSYTLCYYARHRKYNYVVDPLHEYDLEDLKKPYSEECSVFKKKKLVYPSEEIFEACKSNTQVKILNDPFLLDSLETKKRLYGIYERISDYKNFSNQIIFSTPEAFKNFILSSSTLGKTKRVFDSFDEKTVEPYLFQNKEVFDGRVVLVQNVDNSDLGYERAKEVVKIWEEEGKNQGYYSDAKKSDEKRKFYDYEKYKGDFEGSFVCFYKDRFMAILRV